MLKKSLFFFLVGFVGFSQFNQQLDSLKKADNYAEYIYLTLDEFAKKPTAENLSLFEILEKNIWRKPSIKNEYLASIYFNVNYGYYLKRFGDLSQSVLKYEKAKNTFQNNQYFNYDIIEYCLKPLANNYTRLGDFNRAEDILKTTIQIAQKSKNKAHLISGYQNLAIVKRATGNFKTAINYLEEAKKLSVSKQVSSTLYSDIAINYLMLNNLIEAKRFVEVSNKNNIDSNSRISFRNYKTLGAVYFKNNDLKKGLLSYKKALVLGFESFGNYDREIAKTYNEIAKCYVELQDFEKAEFNYRKALETLIILKENFIENLYAENTLKESFDGLAQLYSFTNKPEKALEFYKYSFLVEKEIQQTISSQESKVLMQQEIKKRSEACIEICYELFQQSNNTKWIEKAFRFSESSKSSVLNESQYLLNSKSSFSKDVLIQQEQKLIFRKAQLTKSIALEELKTNKANVNLLANYVKDRDAVSNKLQLVKEELMKKFPSIYGSLKTISVEEICKNILLENQSLIDFFDGEKAVYRFEILKNKSISILKIQKDKEFKNNLLSFIKIFASDRGSEIQNNISNYTNLGFYLYEKLFVGAECDKLIIIPDGLLNFVPFDALITEETNMLNFEKLPYFTKKSQIQLSYSVQLLTRSKYKNEQSFIGFFPVFKKQRDKLSTLKYTVLEAENIKDNFSGTFFMNKNATKDQFTQEAHKASILHLSTHASVGSFYQPPAIEFYNETLYLPEVYGYNLTADLLVLSACETGLGVVRKGEGVMSLARGFSYAGVKNVLVSLWKVNDKATAQLMSSFYKGYSRTNNKSASLHQSKLEYLRSKEISSHKKSPYYWASFVFIGEVDSISNSSKGFLWLLIIPFLLVVSYFLYKKR
ncbi:Tetratricopeptide repeat-containing protein [Lutibacter oricola]|uniref:Tetratricopeptide repeat-containing protein n=1 Tax=Lutibacter oricola TaxID=762486 RepID=A0A1H3G825_9FLAO|nr:CHAT domain-containing protein [Lutibacter oricola]SDX99472.1 Tetratricopeptide repeat-containing protein [Lutibacter oricola]